MSVTQTSECRSLGGGTRLPSIQPPDESILRQTVEMSALYCIHWVHKSRLSSSPKLHGRSEVERGGSERARTARKTSGFSTPLSCAAENSKPSEARSSPSLPPCAQCACQGACGALSLIPSACAHMQGRPLLHQAFPISVLAEAACAFVCLCICACVRARVRTRVSV